MDVIPAKSVIHKENNDEVGIYFFSVNLHDT